MCGDQRNSVLGGHVVLGCWADNAEGVQVDELRGGASPASVLFGIQRVLSSVEGLGSLADLREDLKLTSAGVAATSFR